MSVCWSVVFLIVFSRQFFQLYDLVDYLLSAQVAYKYQN
jgi:hypothetical protein